MRRLTIWFALLMLAPALQVHAACRVMPLAQTQQPYLHMVEQRMGPTLGKPIKREEPMSYRGEQIVDIDHYDLASHFWFAIYRSDGRKAGPPTQVAAFYSGDDTRFGQWMIAEPERSLLLTLAASSVAHFAGVPEAGVAQQLDKALKDLERFNVTKADLERTATMEDPFKVLPSAKISVGDVEVRLRRDWTGFSVAIQRMSCR
jgi:hypothetical protein